MQDPFLRGSWFYFSESAAPLLRCSQFKIIDECCHAAAPQ
jgi:hypothetical protein